MLGQQIPGMSGGLPSLGGLSVMGNPMAQQLQSMGRGDDKMLIHMTPDEVNSLQGLAMAHGGSLTINPETGLPEAGWLGKLLPTIIGAALAATGVGAPLAAGIVAAGSVAKTGSLKKGLMAGLQAFGGAGMAGMAGLGGSISHNALGLLGKNPGFFGANMGLGSIAPAAQGVAAAPVAVTADPLASTSALEMAGPITAPASGIAGGPAALSGAGMGSAVSSGAGAIAPGQLSASLGGITAPTSGLAPSAIQGGGAQFTGGLGSRFAQATRAGLPGGTPGIVSKLAPKAALLGVTSGVSGALTPSGGGSNMGDDGVIDNSYAGPYTAQVREVSYPGQSSIDSGNSSEHLYFSNSMPAVYNMQGQMVQPGSSTKRGTPILQNVLNPKAKKGQNRYTPTFMPYMGGVDPNEEGYARGGEIELSDGAFVLDARTVSEIGNGSSNAGMEALRRIGGRPINGPGDGVSDSIPARIGRDQPARVARDEVLMPADAVRRIGKGNPKKGADKLYSLMNKAHKARKKAKRGQDTKVRRGLA
jgi:hypothetical protein